MELVGTAADGEEIIDLSRTARPEVVLMDIRMHGIDGVTGYYESWWIEGMKEMGHTLRTNDKII